MSDFDYSKPHRIVNGAAVLLTPEEIAARQAEEAAWPQSDERKAALNAPVLAKLAALDPKMLRALEENNDPARIADLKAQRAALRASLLK